jgi:hypothetical protein
MMDMELWILDKVYMENVGKNISTYAMWFNG